MRKYIKSKVEDLVKEHDTRNPYELADALGICLVKSPLGDKIKGVYDRYEEGSFIIFNDNLSEEEEFIVAAHEIGHAVLHDEPSDFHRKYNPFSKNKVLEQESNYFAVNLVVDEAFFLKYEGRTIREISEAIEIPEEILRNKYDEILSEKRELLNKNI